MKYLCMIFFDEKNLEALSKHESDALTDKSLAYDVVLRENGKFIAAQALESAHTAATVKLVGDKVTVSDGAFAETREQVGGFILIEAKDRAEAIEIASKIPPARLGRVEVRPIKELTYSTVTRKA